MKLPSCNTMREGMIVSIFFLIMGALLIILAAKVMPQVAYIPMIANVLGIVLVLASPIILISTFIVTVLPGSKEKLDKCDH